jgi:glycerol uptake facilitator-like aquaporin
MLTYVVTAAFFVVRKISLLKCLAYMCAQVVGAVLGAEFLYFTIWHELERTEANANFTSTKLGVTFINKKLGVYALDAICIEMVLTFVLVTTVFGVSDPKRTHVKHFGPLAVGLTVIGCVLMGVRMSLSQW